MKEIRMVVIALCSKTSDSPHIFKSTAATCIAEAGKIGETLMDYMVVEHPESMIKTSREWETKYFFTIPISKKMVSESHVIKIWEHTWLEIEVRLPWNKEKAIAEKERRARLKRIWLRWQGGPVCFDVEPEKFEEYMKDDRVRKLNKFYGIE